MVRPTATSWATIPTPAAPVSAAGSAGAAKGATSKAMAAHSATRARAPNDRFENTGALDIMPRIRKKGSRKADSQVISC